MSQQTQILKKVLTPSKSALLVIDVQNDFCSPDGKYATWGRDVSQMQSIIPNIQGLIDQAHKAKVQVIFTKGFENVKYRHGPDLLRAAILEEKDGDGSVNSEKGTKGSEFYKLTPEGGDIVLEKYKWSSFDGKNHEGESLDEIFKKLGIETLVTTGVVAETCVETTIRDAYSKNYFVVVPEKSVGSDHPEQLKARMDYWRRGFVGNVVTEDFILDCWPT